jgi:hypothetical protein
MYLVTYHVCYGPVSYARETESYNSREEALKAIQAKMETPVASMVYNIQISDAQGRTYGLRWRPSLVLPQELLGIQDKVEPSSDS